MANLTLSIDEDTLRRSRIRALEMGTSVNELVRAYLKRLADGEEAERREREEIIRAIEALAVDAGSGGQGWSRDSLYERGGGAGGKGDGLRAAEP